MIFESGPMKCWDSTLRSHPLISAIFALFIQTRPAEMCSDEENGEDIDSAIFGKKPQQPTQQGRI